MTDLKFKFGTPEHGWMEVHVIDGDNKLSMMISDVPCNSIHELTKALLELQSGLKRTEVEFSLEPEFALWKFISEGVDLELHIFPGASRDKPIVFKGQQERILKRLYKGLRDLESLQCWQKPDATEAIWSWEFPSHELNQFKLRSEEY